VLFPFNTGDGLMKAHEEFERTLADLNQVNKLVSRYSKTGFLNRDDAVALIKAISDTHLICRKRKRAETDLLQCSNRVIVCELKAVSTLLHCELMIISAG
jgi:hypothetical protein